MLEVWKRLSLKVRNAVYQISEENFLISWDKYFLEYLSMNKSLPIIWLSQNDIDWYFMLHDSLFFSKDTIKQWRQLDTDVWINWFLTWNDKKMNLLLTWSRNVAN